MAVSPATISRWIVETIRFAYSDPSEESLQFARVTAHEVRALSTSWAFFRGTSLSDLLSAVHWRSQSTFSSAYLRDMAVESDGMFSLGPVCVAQRVARTE